MDELFEKEYKLPALNVKIKKKKKKRQRKIYLKKGNNATIKILKETLSDKASWLNQDLIFSK